MKCHKVWIILLIMYLKGSLVATVCDNDDCVCDYEAKTCTCIEDCGKIMAPVNGTRDDPVNLNYTLPSGYTVMRLDSFEGLASSGSRKCNIEFPDGKIIGNRGDAPEIGDIFVYNSFIVNKQNDPSKGKCTWTMTYGNYEYKIFNENLTDTSGTIDTSLKDDEYNICTSRPNTHVHYILQTTQTLGTRCAINVNVTFQNLGVPFQAIHDQVNDATTGDMVLVGLGSNVLSGDEAVLYGTKSNEITRMRIDSDVAHVSFSYNTGNPDVDLHFNYSFTCMEESTTAVPTTVITTPAPPSSNYYTFAAINCIRPHIDEASRLEPAVKQKLALIATMYAEENNLMLDQNITDDQIAIYNEKKCNPVQCNVDKCVAFNYSILYLDEEGKWVFTKEMMDTMVLDHSVEFADIEEGRGCERDNQICIEDPEVSILPYILLSVVVVVIGCIISFIVYRAGRGAVVKENRTKYNKENEERIDDERRRSSGNISMLGLGNNRGSIGSVASSKRFSMPFPTKDRKPRNNVNYDVSGFKEFNPENTLGGETLNLGLEKEFLGNPSSMKTYYSNDAYIPDEVAGTSRVQQQHWDNQEGSSSGSSSDAEDDGPSLPPLSQNHDLARRQLQERLATIQASDSEEDNDSDQDVLFNRNPGTTAQLNASVVPVDVHSYMDHEGETIL